METTFITILDLSPEAHILYSSDSIVDVLGYAPEEVLGQSCWDFFHPDEVPIARQKHGKNISLDKAAVLSYCRMRDRDGYYLGCEVVFTVVHDVMVGCTSIYRRGLKSQNRASEAPVIRRLFSTSPRDPRYHMLSLLSSKFSPSVKMTHEPRAALFLNRYTRTLTIMYATDGLADTLGITGAELRGRSFYYCIQENCLQDAVRCLENAKANDSIAYLRFWYRDPRPEEPAQGDSMDIDERQNENPARSSSEDTDMGGVDLKGHGRPLPKYKVQPAADLQSSDSGDSQAVSSSSSVEPTDAGVNHLSVHSEDPESRTSSGDSNEYTHEAVFGERPTRESSNSSVSDSPTEGQQQPTSRLTQPTTPIELEAVVSCTSDGLVVCLRRAREPVPLQATSTPAESTYRNGLFAVPWSAEPMIPAGSQVTQPNPALTGTALQENAAKAGVPAAGNDFMNSIRDIGVFAWALTGINGSLADYSSGSPRGESQPAAGLPIWRSETTLQGHTNGISVQKPHQLCHQAPDLPSPRDIVTPTLGQEHPLAHPLKNGTYDPPAQQQPE